MDWLQVVVQWLHVLGGITWFGTVIYGDFILIPALMTLTPDIQRAAAYLETLTHDQLARLFDDLVRHWVEHHTDRDGARLPAGEAGPERVP